MLVKVVDMDHKGNGISKIDNKVVFVPKTIYGDICEIEIVKSHNRYDIGKLNKIKQSSSKRIDAICPYYDICGGCNISNLSYDNQLLFKKNKVINMFKKYLNLEINPVIIPSDEIYGYRNKITYHNNNSNKFGLIGEYDNIVEIDYCMLVSDSVNRLYNKIKKEDLSSVEKIIIKECNNGLILSVVGNVKIDNLKEDCLSIYVNNECKYFKEDGYIYIGNIKYIVSSKSFFQINTNNIYKLYDLVVKYGNFSNNDTVIDLYCGVGSISLYIAKYVDKVLGIEIIEEAIKDANRNKEINNISNVKFICSDVSKIIDSNINGDVVIVDPPRTGLDKHTVNVINLSEIKKIIYVSCDPMTLVRDIKLLDKYKLENITLVDMFPQTGHVECVCILKYH